MGSRHSKLVKPVASEVYSERARGQENTAQSAKNIFVFPSASFAGGQISVCALSFIIVGNGT